MKNRSYLDDFKSKYKFLEDYGFVLANDSCNPDRLCYKNKFGEIVLWTKNKKGAFCSIEFYVQINGWKTEIDVISEYKKCIGKFTLFKSFETMVRELFEFRVNTTKEFYGIKVYRNNYKSYEKSSEEPVVIKDDYNPIKAAKNSKLLLTTIIVSIIVMFAQIILMGSLNYVESFEAASLIKTIIYSSILIVGMFVVILFKDYFNIISKIYLVIYPIILLLLLNCLPRRIDYIIYIIFFLFSLFYAGLYIFRYKVMNKEGLSNGLVTCIYPISVFMIKSFELNNDLFLFDLKIDVFAIVAFILSVVSVILFCVLKKDKSNKKNFLGALVTIFCSVMLLTLVIPYTTIETINYTFDDSIGENYEFLIIDKQIGYSTGRYTTRKYYITAIINGEEEQLTVDSYIYYSYDIDEIIDLVYHEGFLGHSYFEFVSND